MQKFSVPFIVIVLPLLALLFCSSEKNGTKPDDGEEKIMIQTWRMTELRFESNTDYSSSGADAVLMDVVFKHNATGETISRPAFWDGRNVFLVRFAPTKEGKWTWKSSCPGDKSLNNKKGKLVCKKYNGNLAIYQHGFVRVEPGKKYLTYADGTPFFYLGDTHWGMYREEIDAAGPNAGNTGAASHFKYIVDRRAEQGFTVYQSEPIDASFHVQDGKVDAEDIFGFRQADRYYQHIADRGLVHANAEFFFASEMKSELAFNDAALERISRYWVARFGAFPVFWTLAQEIDNDFYNEKGDQKVYDFTNNPWVKVAEYIHKHDAYNHPLSGHQENTWHTTITGRGPNAEGRDGEGRSVFASEDVAKRTGHDWWAAQWSPSLGEPVNPELVRDYLESPWPAVNYEGRYCYLWTKDFGARVQGWLAFLSGFCGYGYGAIDMWLYKSTFNIDVDSNDGIDQITVADKARPWSEALEFPSSKHVGYMKSFLEEFNWWELTPVLPGDSDFAPTATAYACAKTNDRYVMYFFSKAPGTGTIKGLAPYSSFNLEWFNPRTGEKGSSVQGKSDSNGDLKLPDRPDPNDWTLTVRIKQPSNLVEIPGYNRLRPDNIDEIVKAMTDEEKALLMVGLNEFHIDGAGAGTRSVERLGIPATISSDGPAGLHIHPTRPGTEKTFYCTAFPVGSLSASSWDPELMELMTGALGNEVLEYGVDMFLGPGMNIHRIPLCGRNFEYFSEDPVLSGRMAAAYVRGIQSNGVTATVKHYAANNQETNRNENDARISKRALREIYLKNFEIAVKEGHPGALMASYNKVNGEYTQQSYDLLTTILRDEWGFDGVVMTDHGVKDSTARAARAGCDLMEPGSEIEAERMLESVKTGAISREELDRNARNILRYIVSTPHYKGYKYSETPDLKAHAAVARKVAGESMVLLKNDGGTLPLKGDESVALYGVGSEDFVAVGIGSGHVIAKHVVNMRESLTDAGFHLNQDLADYYKSYVEMDFLTKKLQNRTDPIGYFAWGYGKKVEEADVPLENLPQQAKKEDVAIIVFSRDSGEGIDRPVANDFELSAKERTLLRRVCDEFHAKGKKVIVILNIGGVIETSSWKHLPDAILLPWQPGQEGAHAVADVLTGKVNPSGKLTMTFPIDVFDHPSSANFPTCPVTGEVEEGRKKNVDYTEYTEGIWVGYRHFATRGIEVSYPFGYGLSYTTFEYSKPVVKSSGDGFTASVTVTNTGKVAGKEIVQLYVSAPSGGLEKPSRELKAFGKTRLLAPGESQTLSFAVSSYELASFNEAESAWETPSGDYHVQFGASVEDIRVNGVYRSKKNQSWKVNDVL